MNRPGSVALLREIRPGFIAVQAVLLLVMALCAGCLGESCPENEHMYSGRCVCDFGYVRVIDRCRTSQNSSDGDADTGGSTDRDLDIDIDNRDTDYPDSPDLADQDTDTVDTDTVDTDTVDTDTVDNDPDVPAELDLPHAGTCVDPYPLQLDTPLAMDFSEAIDRIQNPCRIFETDFSWDGPDHVFGFTFESDMLEGTPRFEVQVSPRDNTRMTYTVYMYYDVSGWGVEACDFPDINTYCIAQQGLTMASGTPLTVSFGEPDINARLGQTVYIVVDTVDDTEYPPGPYVISIRQLPGESGGATP